MRRLIFITAVFAVIIFSSESSADYYGDNLDEMVSDKRQDMEQVVIVIKESDYRLTDAGEIIEVTGETNLPDDIELWVFIKRRDEFITGVNCLVEKGRYGCTIGPFMKEFYPGLYDVQVSFMPRRQNLKILADLKQEWAAKEVNEHRDILIGGTKEEIIAAQEEIVKSIRESISNVEKLYEELVKSLKAYKKKEISEFQWKTWALDWNRALDKEQQLNRERNEGKVVALFPRAEDEFEGLMGQLWLLEKLYEKKMQGKKTGMFDPKDVSPKIKSTLSDIKFMINVDFWMEDEDDDDSRKESSDEFSLPLY